MEKNASNLWDFLQENFPTIERVTLKRFVISVFFNKNVFDVMKDCHIGLTTASQIIYYANAYFEVDND